MIFDDIFGLPAFIKTTFDEVHYWQVQIVKVLCFFLSKILDFPIKFSYPQILGNPGNNDSQSIYYVE